MRGWTPDPSRLYRIFSVNISLFPDMKPRNLPIWEHFIESTKPENSNGSIVLCQINGCWNILKAPLRRKPKVDSFFTLSSSFASPGGRTPAPVSSTSTRDNEDKKMHLLIPKMIILDFVPFSLVERPGFLSLLHSLNRNYVVRSWKFYTELLPAKFKQMAKNKSKSNWRMRTVGLLQFKWMVGQLIIMDTLVS